MILAFYVLLEDHIPKKNKKSSQAPEVGSAFDQGVPQEFIPQDVSVYYSEKKLNADLEYREARLEHLIESEKEKFFKNHDYQGKDKKAYQEMMEKHTKAREEFRQMRRDLKKRLKEEKNEAIEDRGLR